MSSFLEKLKKGMNIEDLPKEDIEECSPSNQEKKEEENFINEIKQTEKIIEEPSVVFTSTKIDKEKVERTKKPEKKTKTSERKTKSKKKKIIVKEENKESQTTKIKDKNWFKPEGQLVVDVYQTEEEIVIQSAIAGVKPEELDISIENDMVTIKGKREKLFEKAKTNYFYQECYWGPFSREIILPMEVDVKRAKATMENGILTIRMPKILTKKKRKIIVGE